MAASTRLASKHNVSGININEYWHGIDQKHRAHCTLPGVSRHDNFVSRLNVNRLQGSLDGNCSRVDALRVFDRV
jgi:hypothetical protein